MVGPDSEGIWYLLYQFYQLVVLLALVVGGFVFYVVSTRAPRKKPAEAQTVQPSNEVQQKPALDVPPQEDDSVGAMVRNRSETLLLTKELQAQLAGELLAQNIKREPASIDADADDEEEEEEEEEDDDVAPTPRRRRIIGEVTVQKVVFPAQSQYSDSQITAAREMIRKNIDRKLTSNETL